MAYLIDILALIGLYCFVFFKRWKKRGLDVLVVNSCMYLYLSFVLYFAMMPVIFSLPTALRHAYRPMNIIPFIDVSLGRGDFVRQIVLNVAMTIPFGFLFPLIRDKRRKRAGFVKTVFCCFLMSLGIELVQPFFFRHSDITDLITNVAGGAAGYLLSLLFRPLTDRFLAFLEKFSKR